MTKILIVEDDKLINDGIKKALVDKGYIVYQAESMMDTMKLMDKNCDLILLDINLPDSDGFRLCKKIKSTTDASIIFITAQDTEEDILKGFELGGDDYVTKPFSLPILIKRIEAVLKRQVNDSKDIYVINDLVFNFDSKTLSKNGKGIVLTLTETKILSLLIKNKNNILTRNKLLELVWDIDGNFVDEKALNVNISRLRKKIEDNGSEPKYIKTVFGIGYKWSDSV